MLEKEQTSLPLETFTTWLDEIQQQPSWRTKADREAKYYDGNQLDSEVLRKQREIGIPPAVEPLIGSTIDAVLGAEAKSRTDWRVLPVYGLQESARPSIWAGVSVKMPFLS